MKAKVLEVQKTSDVLNLSNDEIIELLQKDFLSRRLTNIEAYIDVMKERDPFSFLNIDNNKLPVELIARTLFQFHNVGPLMDPKASTRVRMPVRGVGYTRIGDKRGFKEDELVGVAGFVVQSKPPIDFIKDGRTIMPALRSLRFRPIWSLEKKTVALDRIQDLRAQLESSYYFVLGAGAMTTANDRFIETFIPSPVQPANPQKLSDHTQQLLKTLEKGGIMPRYRSETDPYFDLARIPSQLEYYGIGYLSTGNTDYLTKLEKELSGINASIQRLRDTQEKQYLQQVQVSKIVKSIGKKLGPDTLKSLKVVISYGHPEQILNALSKEDRRLVEIDIKIQNDIVSSFENNKCEHVKVLKDVDFSKTRDQQAMALSQVEKLMINKNTEDDLIKCKVCKLNLICPHVYEKLHMEIKGMPFGKIKAGLEKFASKRTSTDDIYTTYCRICGGYISFTIPGDQDTYALPFTNVDLEDYTQFVSAEIYKFCNGLKFDALISSQTLIRIGLNTILPMIAGIDNDIVKSKRKATNLDDIRVKLYIKILVYAFMLRITTLKELQGQIRPKKGSITFAYVYERLMRNIQDDIRDLSDISAEFILSKLKQYYLSLKVSLGHGKTDDDPKNILVKRLITTDPTYRIARLAAVIDKKIPLRFKDTQENMKREIETVLGQNMSIIFSKKPGLFSKIFTPTRAIRGAGRGGLFRGFIDGGRLSTSKVIHLKEVDDTYFLYWRYMNLDQRDPKAVAEYYDLLSMSNKTTTTSPQYRILSSLEEGLGQTTIDITVFANAVFDENGNRHIWNRYSFGGEFYSLSDLHRDPNLVTDRLVDLKCSVCGITKSSINKIDSQKVIATLRNKSLVDRVVSHFNFVCPLGGIHEYANGRCKKCQYSKTMSESEKLDFTQRYEDKLQNRFSKLEEAPEYTRPQSSVEWTYDHGKIVKLSEVLSVDIRILECLGIQGVKYNDLLAGKVELDPPTSFSDYRFLELEATIRDVVIMYSRFQNISRLQKIPDDFQEVITQSKVDASLLSQLSTLLPVIDQEYETLYKELKRSLSPDKVLDFLRQTFSEILLGMETSNPKISSLVREIRKYIATKVFDRQKFMNKREQTFVIEADDFEEIEINDPKFDPFSYENMDYDGNNEENS